MEDLAQRYGAKLEEPVFGASSGFRVRAKLAVRGRANSPKLGIFQEGSHRIVDIPRCPIQHETINAAAAALRHAMKTCSVSPYADRPHVGAVRAAQVVVERSSKRAQLTVVENAQQPGALADLFSVLQDSLGEQLHSLWWNGNPERSNVVLGPHWQHVSGPRYVEEQIGGAKVFFPPSAFGQSNLDGADCLVGYVHQLAADANTVAEFYAGCGAISLGLLAAGKQVLANEIVADAIEALRRGAAELGPDAERHLTLHCGDAQSAKKFAAEADVVVVDPPRKGVEAPLRDTLRKTPPKRLIYVSCGLPSLLRDLEDLQASGTLKLETLRCFDLFPYTEHVETVAVLDRT